MDTNEINPFAAPSDLSGLSGGRFAETDPGAIRRQYLSHEGSIRGMGFIWFVGGVLIACAVVFNLIMAFREILAAGVAGAVLAAILLGVGALAVWQCWMGLQLRDANPRGRGSAIVLGSLSLIVFPLGTIVGGYLLYLVLSTKGEYVLSDAYVAIRQATPDMKGRPSIIFWIVFGLLLAFGALVIVGAALQA